MAAKIESISFVSFQFVYSLYEMQDLDWIRSRLTRSRNQEAYKSPNTKSINSVFEPNLEERKEAQIMDTILTSDGESTTDLTMFGETFSSGNGEEIAVEPLESAVDGKDENCKSCQ